MGVSQFLLFFSALLLTSCSSGILIETLGGEPYLSKKNRDKHEMTGVENLAFDGEGSLYVSGLNGRIFLIKPESDYRGKIEASVEVGDRCFGITVGNNGWVYVGVEKKGERKIYKINKELNKDTLAPLSKPIQGLNGIDLDRKGYLYYTSWNNNHFSPQGWIFRVNINNEYPFDKPKMLKIGNIGWVNGLALSFDEKILYFTDTKKGIWSFGLESERAEKIYSPRGPFLFIDDLTTRQDGTVWFAFNSETAIGVIKTKMEANCGYRVGDLGAPSSVKFGSGSGFRPDFLYITEFGRWGRIPITNGRGIWVLPLDSMTVDEKIGDYVCSEEVPRLINFSG